MTRQRPTPLVGTLTVIGLGLIGSSIARAAKKARPCGHDPGRRRVRRRSARQRARSASSTRRRRISARRSTAPTGRHLRADRRLQSRRRRDRAAPETGRDPERCRLGQAGGVHPARSPVAARRSLHSRPSGGGHRIFRPRGGLRRTVRESLVHPDAANRLPTARPWRRSPTFWTRLGSKVEFMDAEHHDLVLAITSHVPHLIAYNIVGTASDLEEVTQSEVIKYSAGGFRDFTRIAASDPDHVARCLPQQQGRRAGDAGPLRRGSDGACSAPSAGATATPCSPTSPAPGRSARALSTPARKPPSPISAAATERSDRYLVEGAGDAAGGAGGASLPMTGGSLATGMGPRYSSPSCIENGRDSVFFGCPLAFTRLSRNFFSPGPSPFASGPLMRVDQLVVIGEFGGHRTDRTIGSHPARSSRSASP